MDDLVVRRRAGLMAFVSAAALVVAAGYLWRFAVAPSSVALLGAVVLVAVGVLHGIAWRTSRVPLAAADALGLRLRLGSAWFGLTWEEIERVEVDAPQRFRDGHIAVAPLRDADVMAGLAGSARWAARLNKLVYGAPFVAPFGVSTATNATDIATALEELSAGRARVLRVDEDVDPEPSVELTAPAATESATADRPASRSLARAVSALRSLSARDLGRSAPAGRGEPATLGALALARNDDDERTVELPELEHLRRQAEFDEEDALVASADQTLQPFDRTTDAGPWADEDAEPAGRVLDEPLAGRQDRVVARVTWGLPGDAVDVSDDPAGEPTVAPPLPARPTLLIGDQIAEAREHLRLSVDELAERTRIRPYVIEAIEADDFGPCGGDFYARGHLRMLARMLGIDAGPLLATYDAAFAAAPVDPRAVFDAELRTGASGRASGSAGGPSWALLLGTVLVLLLVWGVARYLTADTSAAPAGAVTTRGNAAGLGSPGAGDKPLPPTHTVHITLRGVGGRSAVVVTDRSDRVLFSGTLLAGHQKQLSGAAPLQVRAGNAGVVSMTAPGHRAGLLGERGRHVVTEVRAP